MNSSKIRFISFLFSLLILTGGLFSFGYYASALSTGDVSGVQVTNGGDPCSIDASDQKDLSSNVLDVPCNIDNGGGGGTTTTPVTTTPTPNPPVVTTSNSSSSVTVIVEPDPGIMSGILKAEDDSCIIKLGSSSCNVNLTWTVTNPTGTETAITASGMTDYVSPSVSDGGPTAFLVPHGSRIFFLYNNESKLDEAEVEAVCDPETSNWSDYYGQCVNFTVVRSGLLNISPSACTIASGASTCTVTGATWSTENAIDPYLKDTNTGATLSTLSDNLTPLKVWVAYPKTIFELNDKDGNLDTKEVTASCISGTVWNTTQGKCAEEEIDLCPNIPGIQTTLPCTEINTDLCPDVPGIQTTTELCPEVIVDLCPNVPGVQTTTELCPEVIVDLCPNVPGVQTTLPCDTVTIDSCPAPLTQTVEVACDSQNGVEAISGSVLRSQSKSAYPMCAFETPITVNNSTYVSDTCVYLENVCTNGSTNYPDCNNIFCPAPLTQTVEVACDSQNGVEAISGSVLRSQSKSAYPICEFGYPITAYNSTYVSDSCKYPSDDGDDGNGGDGGGNYGDPYWITTCGLCDANKVKQCQSVCSENPSTGKLCNGDVDGIRNYTTQIGCVGTTTGGGTEILNIILKATPDRIFKGKSATLEWNSIANSCVGEGFDTGSQPEGSAIVSPKETTTYGITCTNGADTESTSATIKVNTINIIES